MQPNINQCMDDEHSLSNILAHAEKKWCPFCSKDGTLVALRHFQISMHEALYMCPQQECCFPFVDDNLASYVVHRSSDQFSLSSRNITTDKWVGIDSTLEQREELRLRTDDELRFLESEQIELDRLIGIGHSLSDEVSSEYRTIFESSLNTDELSDLCLAISEIGEGINPASTETHLNTPTTEGCHYEHFQLSQDTELPTFQNTLQTDSADVDRSLFSDELPCFQLDTISPESSFKTSLEITQEIHKIKDSVYHNENSFEEHGNLENVGLNQINEDDSHYKKDSVDETRHQPHHFNEQDGKQVKPHDTQDNRVLELPPPPRQRDVVQWKNERNSCWLDVLLQYIVSSPLVRMSMNCNIKLNRKNKDFIYRLCSTFDETQAEYKKLVAEHGCTEKSLIYEASSLCQRLAQVRLDVLNLLGTSSTQCLKGTRESALEMFQNIIKLDPVLEKLFSVKIWWEFECEECGFEQRRRSTNSVISFPSTTQYFHPLNAEFLRPCFKCSAKQQSMTMIMEEIPPCVVMHFLQGLPHNNLQMMDFGIQGQLYSVSAAIQYITEPHKHFIAWIRDTKTNQWLCCDDLKNITTTWRKGKLKINAKEIHIVIWEKQGLLSTLSPSGNIPDLREQHLQSLVNEAALIKGEETCEVDATIDLTDFPSDQNTKEEDSPTLRFAAAEKSPATESFIENAGNISVSETLVKSTAQEKEQKPLRMLPVAQREVEVLEENRSNKLSGEDESISVTLCHVAAKESDEQGSAELLVDTVQTVSVEENIELSSSENTANDSLQDCGHVDSNEFILQSSYQHSDLSEKEYSSSSSISFHTVKRKKVLRKRRISSSHIPSTGSSDEEVPTKVKKLSLASSKTYFQLPSDLLKCILSPVVVLTDCSKMIRASTSATSFYESDDDSFSKKRNNSCQENTEHLPQSSAELNFDSKNVATHSCHRTNNPTTENVDVLDRTFCDAIAKSDDNQLCSSPNGVCCFENSSNIKSVSDLSLTSVENIKNDRTLNLARCGKGNDDVSQTLVKTTLGNSCSKTRGIDISCHKDDSVSAQNSIEIRNKSDISVFSDDDCSSSIMEDINESNKSNFINTSSSKNLSQTHVCKKESADPSYLGYISKSSSSKNANAAIIVNRRDATYRSRTLTKNVRVKKEIESTIGEEFNMSTECRSSVSVFAKSKINSSLFPDPKYVSPKYMCATSHLSSEIDLPKQSRPLKEVDYQLNLEPSSGNRLASPCTKNVPIRRKAVLDEATGMTESESSEEFTDDKEDGEWKPPKLNNSRLAASLEKQYDVVKQPSTIPVRFVDLPQPKIKGFSMNFLSFKTQFPPYLKHSNRSKKAPLGYLKINKFSCKANHLRPEAASTSSQDLDSGCGDCGSMVSCVSEEIQNDLFESISQLTGLSSTPSDAVQLHSTKCPLATSPKNQTALDLTPLPKTDDLEDFLDNLPLDVYVCNSKTRLKSFSNAAENLNRDELIDVPGIGSSIL